MKKENVQYRKKYGYRGFVMSLFTMLLVLGNGMVAFADTNYAGNAADWFLEQLFWVALVVIIVVVIGLAAKRNFTAAVTTAIAGAVVVYFIKNPKTLEDIGDAIMGTVLK